MIEKRERQKKYKNTELNQGGGGIKSTLKTLKIKSKV